MKTISHYQYKINLLKIDIPEWKKNTNACIWP